MIEYRYIDREETKAMNILQKHTAQYFGTMHNSIQRTVNYSAQRKSNMTLLDRVLYR